MLRYEGVYTTSKRYRYSLRIDKQADIDNFTVRIRLVEYEEHNANFIYRYYHNPDWTEHDWIRYFFNLIFNL